MDRFIAQLKALDFKWKVVIPGNHEVGLDKDMPLRIKKSYFGKDPPDPAALWQKLR